MPTGYYIHDVTWANSINQYNSDGTLVFPKINGTAGTTYSYVPADASSLMGRLFAYDYYGQFTGSSNTKAPAVYTQIPMTSK